MGLGAFATVPRTRFILLANARTTTSNASGSQVVSIAPISIVRLFSRRHSDVNASPSDTSTPSPTSEPWNLNIQTPGSPLAADPLERLKHPARGGQDLSHRYRRLERALRGKEAYEREIDDFDENRAETDRKSGAGVTGETRPKGRKKKKSLVFQGFTIPEAPKPPGPDECCMSGCAVCVHDLYAGALDAHEHALDRIRYALHDKGVDEETWPRQLRHDSGDTDDAGTHERKEDLTGKDLVKAKQASLSAFEQMELQLAARHAALEQQSQAPNMNRQSTPRGTESTLGKPQPMLDAERRLAETRSGRSARYKSGLNGKSVLKALEWVIFSRR